MVEFRVATDGTPYLMEVNGRFWGSLQLAIDSGIDFPWLAHCLTWGLPIDARQPYSVGRRLRWLLGDLDSLILSVRDPESDRHAKSQAIGSFLRSFVDPACRQEILRIRDPQPAFRELSQWLRALQPGRNQ